MGLQKISQGNQTYQQKSMLSLQKSENDSYSVYGKLLNKEAPISTRFIHNDKPVISPEQCCVKEKNSIMDTIDTGFGGNNTIIQECSKPKYKVPLYKENYLSEFKEETEKAKARENLEIYSKQEVNKLVSEIVANDTGTFITILEVKEMLEDLDFVDSTLKGKANYDIPNNLFKL